MDRKKKEANRPSGVFKTGAISLAFLIVCYQSALFVHKAAAERIVANRDRPDTVFVVDSALAEKVLGASQGSFPVTGDAGCGPVTVRKSSVHSPAARAVARAGRPRTYESFPFNPNTVSVEDLMRLGFSERQAQSIDNYRKSGGRFRRKGDFAKSFVVSDSLYKRLEPYIRIPKIDINKADSAAFDSLPGIGGWFAARMVEYRERLHGYSCPEQLMEIHRFDKERYDALKDLITCSPAKPYPLWSLPADSLRLHPHVKSWQTARAIVFYREHNPVEKLTVDGLLDAGVISADQADRLRRCRLE